MDAAWCVAFLLILSIHYSEQRSNVSALSYKAAVVEYNPILVEKNAEETLSSNVAAYGNLIQQAATQDADIIVFPEDGLTSVSLPMRKELDPWSTLVPSPSDNYVPCGNNIIPVSETIRSLSCAAQKNKIYLVINILEKYPCTGSDCPSDKHLYYNTNVAFDRNGKIIARYRKTNLFLEPSFNVTKEPEHVTFDTDFGVTFGTFTCFDILFKEPAIYLTRKLGIRDFVFPTAWFSETPFLTAIQTQEGWAYAEDVNLLASGYNNPEKGNAGSGIYLGRDGIGQAVIPTAKTNELVVFDVIKKPRKMPMQEVHHHDHDHAHHSNEQSQSEEHVHDELRKKRLASGLALIHENLSIFESKILTSNGSTTEKLCQKDFCCEFNVKVVNLDPSSLYRFVVFDGVRKYVKIINAGTSVCALVQCTNDSISSCGYIKDSETSFESIGITGTFQNNDDTLVMPSTLDSDVFPLSGWHYDEHKHEKHVHVTITLDSLTRNLVTFGIYARDFSRDSATMMPNVGVGLYMAVVILWKMF